MITFKIDRKHDAAGKLQSARVEHIINGWYMIINYGIKASVSKGGMSIGQSNRAGARPAYTNRCYYCETTHKDIEAGINYAKQVLPNIEDNEGLLRKGKWDY